MQMTLDDDLVKEVDRAARKIGTTRSAFTREALRRALRVLEEKELETRHRRGYQAKPVRRGEFDSWTREQMWPE